MRRHVIIALEGERKRGLTPEQAIFEKFSIRMIDRTVGNSLATQGGSRLAPTAPPGARFPA
jgi:hypothetical protein